jgi:hypothetical protein
MIDQEIQDLAIVAELPSLLRLSELRLSALRLSELVLSESGIALPIVRPLDPNDGLFSICSEKSSRNAHFTWGTDGSAAPQ